MSTHSDRLAAGNEASLAGLQHWATTTPDGVALLHKRRGRWRAFRWADVDHTVARRTETLKAHGFGVGSRLAVSGAYEPELIFISLAAYALGGTVLPVDRNVVGDNLAQALAGFHTTHAFAQSRRIIARWVAVQLDDRRRPLFSGQPAVRESDHWEILALAEASEPVSEPQALRRHLRKHAVVWVDEGTEWCEGLQTIRDSWLTSGRALAFPEAEGSVTRDRREIQPTDMLSSEVRRKALDEESHRRLSGWSRRFAEARPRHPLARLITARRDAVLGLGRLRPIQA
jgi:hypothetical protein